MDNNFVPIKRPKPEDGEEELLLLQQEFNEKKISPAAKVINLKSHNSKEFPVKKKSKFAQQRSIEAQKKRIFTSQGCGNITNINEGCYKFCFHCPFDL